MERAQPRRVRNQIGWSQERMASELEMDKNLLMELEREKGFYPEEGRRVDTVLSSTWHWKILRYG